MEDDTNKIITAHTMPREGPDELAVARMMQDIRLFWTQGYHLKSGQEPAIEVSMSGVPRRRATTGGCRRRSRAQCGGRHPGHRAIERAALLIDGLDRVAMPSLEPRIVTKVEPARAAMTWLTECATLLLGMHEV